MSAATTAIGWPAYTGSAASSGARVVSERSLSGPIAARTPGTAQRRLEVERADASVRDRRAQHGGMEHPGELHVDGEPHAPGCPRGTVLARRGPADERELGVGRPVLDVVRLVDEHPDVLVAALHLLLRANEAGGHAPPAARRIARSIFGYAPQRQRLPAIASWICSRVGCGVRSSSAVALTIWPGVQ